MIYRTLHVLAAALTLATIGVGCSTQKEVAGVIAGRSVAEFQKDLDAIPAQIDTVMSKLTTLTAGDTTNRAAALSEYSKELGTLTKQAAGVAEARDQAEAGTQRFFREWLKESRTIKSPAERDAALQALDQGRARTDTAMGYLRNASSDFRALSDQFTGIQSTLTKDLSAESVQRVGSQLGPVFDKAIGTKNYIARLSEQIDASLMGK